jgi:hypothetical protein
MGATTSTQIWQIIINANGLPENREMRTSADGQPHFFDQNTKTTSWTDPSTSQNQSLALPPASPRTSARSIKVQSPASTLCSSCSELFRGTRHEKALGGACPYPVPGNQTLLKLESSAENGCHLCYLCLGQLNSQEKSLLEGCSKINYGFWRDAGALGIAFEYHFPNSDHGQRKPYLTKSFLCQPKISRLQFNPQPCSFQVDCSCRSREISRQRSAYGH